MVELIPSISKAFDLLAKLTQVSEKVKNAEIDNLLADLSIELANTKIKVASLLLENNSLQARITEIQSGEEEPCPKCKVRGWVLENSKPDPVFGDLGTIRRTYKCSSCGFSEQKLIDS